jgi:hypothetical protein
VDQPLSLEELYDEATLRALELRGSIAEGKPSSNGRVGRGGLAGLMLSGMLLGLRNTLENPPEEEPVVELRPDGVDDEPRWVSFVHVPGLPQWSRIVVRPWLAPRGGPGRSAHAGLRSGGGQIA